MEQSVRRGLLFWVLTALLLLANSRAVDAAIAVGGGLSDWGILIGTGNSGGTVGNIYTYGTGNQSTNFQTTYAGNWNGITDGNPASADGSATFNGGWRGSSTAADGTLYYHVEDQYDTAPNGVFNGPLYGGQDYDAEFLGVVIKGGKIFIAVVTGQRNDNGITRFSPGDILIQTDSSTYGIEVGGGVGSATNSGEYIVRAGSAADATQNASGSTYNIVQTTGLTNSTTPLLTTAAAQTAGTVWKTGAVGSKDNWIEEHVGGLPDSLTQMQMTGGSAVGQADYIFTEVGGESSNAHAIIELSFDISKLGSVRSVQWTMGCGNDGLLVNLPAVAVPEPTTLGVWGLGCVCVFGYKRWRRRRV